MLESIIMALATRKRKGRNNRTMENLLDREDIAKTTESLKKLKSRMKVESELGFEYFKVAGYYSISPIYNMGFLYIIMLNLSIIHILKFILSNCCKKFIS